MKTITQSLYSQLLTTLKSPNHRGFMTVYIVIVTHISGGWPSIDVFERLQDAEARLKRAQARFPLHEGWNVMLQEKWLALGYSAVQS